MKKQMSGGENRLLGTTAWSLRKWYAESVDTLAVDGMEDRAGRCWPDVSHEPRCSMAHEPTKLQPSRIGKKSVSVYLSPEKWREVKVLAAATDTTIDALVRRGVDLVLAEHKGKVANRSGGA